MIFIADCGGTKVHWCLIDKGDTVCEFCTPGMNALMLTPEAMTNRIHEEVLPQIKQWPERYHMYTFMEPDAPPRRYAALWQQPYATPCPRPK